MVKKFPALFCQKLMSTLSSIESGEVFYRILWVLGKYIKDNEGITVAVQEVWKVIRELPIRASKQRALEEMKGGEDEKERILKGGRFKNNGEAKSVGRWNICDGDCIYKYGQSEIGGS